MNEKIEILQKEENVYNSQNFNLLLKVATNVKKENINKEDKYKNKDDDENIDTSLDNFKHYVKIKFHRTHEENEKNSDEETKKDSTFFFEKVITLLAVSENSENIHLQLQEINEEIFLATTNLVYHFTTPKEYTYWKENTTKMSIWNKWKIYNENRETSIPTIKNHIRNSIYNMINTYPSLMMKNQKQKQKQKQKISENSDLIQLNHIFQNENENVSKIFSNIDQSKLQRILCFLEIIPNNLYEESVNEELYRFCWILLFFTFLERNEQIRDGYVLIILYIELRI